MADAATLKAQANAAFSAKKFEEASELYSKAIELDPSNHVLYSNRSASRASLHQYEGALEDAEKCIALDPKFVKAYTRKGAALHGLRKYEDAVMAYEEGLQIEPSNAALKKGLDDVKRAMDSAGPPGGAEDGLGKLFQSPDMFGKLAANPKTAPYLSDAAFVNKLKELQKGGGKDFGAMLGDPRMLTCMGVLMGIDLQAFERPEGSTDMPTDYTPNPPTSSSTSKPSDADVEMKDTNPPPEPTPASSTSKSATVEEDEPMPLASDKPSTSTSTASGSSKKPEPVAEADEPSEEDLKKKNALEMKARGTEAYKKKDFDSAAKEFENAWAEWPKDVTFLTNLAAVYFEQGEYQKCIEISEQAVDEGRSLRADFKLIAKSLGRVGSAYEKLGDLTNAIKFYQKSLTEHRTPDVLAKLKDAEKAKKTADEQAYIDPDLAEKAREEGNAQFKAGQFADSVKSYTEAIKRLPTDPRGYNNRAAAYTKLAALPEALKDAEKAIEIDPTFIRAYIRKAMVLIGMKEYNKALEACQAATEADVEKKHTKEIEQQMQKCMAEMYTQRAGETEEQTLERAMRDPEVAKIMTDPVMQQILQQAQSDPKALQDHMKNPAVRANIQKLVAAGVIKMGSR